MYRDAFSEFLAGASRYFIPYCICRICQVTGADMDSFFRMITELSLILNDI